MSAHAPAPTTPSRTAAAALREPGHDHSDFEAAEVHLAYE
jgi:hypothetical protein